MSNQSIAYIFQQQQLLVDANLQLPRLQSLDSDLSLSIASNTTDQIIARDFKDIDTIPAGFQFVPIRQLVMQWSKTEFEQASRALQLLEWRRNHRFCSHCGEHTEVHAAEYCMVCPSCHYHQYPRINPCIITIITKGHDEVLLAKSVRQKDTNIYSLIAGFVEVGETLEQAVAREALEEVGVKLKNIRYLASQPWPFPSNLMLAFHAEYESGELVLQKDEIQDAQFFKFDALPDLPFAGSIAHQMIMHIVKGQAL
ncbi:MAG: NAD(+) diphosphatase [Acinetobacter sp.]